MEKKQAQLPQKKAKELGVSKVSPDRNTYSVLLSDTPLSDVPLSDRLNDIFYIQSVSIQNKAKNEMDSKNFNLNSIWTWNIYHENHLQLNTTLYELSICQMTDVMNRCEFFLGSHDI